MSETNVSVQRLVRWEFVDEDDAAPMPRWELRRHDGTSAATVWRNGVWHTWDTEGCGGENSMENTARDAKMEAVLSAINQGFLEANKEN